MAGARSRRRICCRGRGSCDGGSPGRPRHFSSTRDASGHALTMIIIIPTRQTGGTSTVLVLYRDFPESHLRVGGGQFLHLVPEVFAAVFVLIPIHRAMWFQGRDGVRLPQMQAVHLLTRSYNYCDTDFQLRYGRKRPAVKGIYRICRDDGYRIFGGARRSCWT